jgi:hypothetical protein
MKLSTARRSASNATWSDVMLDLAFGLFVLFLIVVLMRRVWRGPF